MGFKLDKSKAMKKFNSALKKGEVDKPIISLLKVINILPDFYTTSSCAGRVILLHEFGKRKIDNKFILKEHEKVSVDKFLKIDLKDKKGRIWLKQEPFIIHIVSRSLENAKDILGLGLKSGLKHSGIFVFKPERYIIELNGTQNLSVPITDNKKMLVSKDYLNYLLKLADEKLQKNKEMRENFSKLIMRNYAK